MLRIFLLLDVVCGKPLPPVRDWMENSDILILDEGVDEMRNYLFLPRAELRRRGRIERLVFGEAVLVRAEKAYQGTYYPDLKAVDAYPRQLARTAGFSRRDLLVKEIYRVKYHLHLRWGIEVPHLYEGERLQCEERKFLV